MQHHKQTIFFNKNTVAFIANHVFLIYALLPFYIATNIISYQLKFQGES